MSKFARGQIWLVNFDLSFGHEYKKVRPALIVQNDRYIESSNLLTVIPISSQTIKQTALDILIKKDSQNRLMTDSLLKIKQISSFRAGY
ncbi:MAG: type II toxin-antitoxin system PemK/MazF family toxin [bacterium]